MSLLYNPVAPLGGLELLQSSPFTLYSNVVISYEQGGVTRRYPPVITSARRNRSQYQEGSCWSTWSDCPLPHWEPLYAAHSHAPCHMLAYLDPQTVVCTQHVNVKSSRCSILSPVIICLANLAHAATSMFYFIQWCKDVVELGHIGHHGSVQFRKLRVNSYFKDDIG